MRGGGVPKTCVLVRFRVCQASEYLLVTDKWRQREYGTRRKELFRTVWATKGVTVYQNYATQNVETQAGSTYL